MIPLAFLMAGIENSPYLFLSFLVFVTPLFLLQAILFFVHSTQITITPEYLIQQRFRAEKRVRFADIVDVQETAVHHILLITPKEKLTIPRQLKNYDVLYAMLQQRIPLMVKPIINDTVWKLRATSQLISQIKGLLILLASAILAGLLVQLSLRVSNFWITAIVAALFLTVFWVFALVRELFDPQEITFTDTLICVYTRWHGDRCWETVDLTQVDLEKVIKRSHYGTNTYHRAVIAFNTGIKIRLSPRQASAFGYSPEQIVSTLHELYPNTKTLQPLPSSKKELADALLAQGDKHRREMKTREAIAVYERAIALFPDYAAHKTIVADLYFELGEYDRAIEAYRHGLAFTPDNAEARKRLGTCCLHTENYEEAVKAFAESLRLAPGNADALYQGAIAYSRLNDTEQARLYVQKALAINPNLRRLVLQNPLLNTLGVEE